MRTVDSKSLSEVYSGLVCEDVVGVEVGTAALSPVNVWVRITVVEIMTAVERVGRIVSRVRGRYWNRGRCMVRGVELKADVR